MQPRPKPRPSPRRRSPRRARWPRAVRLAGLACLAASLAWYAGPLERAAEIAARRWHQHTTAAEYAARFEIPQPLARAIVRAAEDEGVDTELAFRLVRVESDFHEWAVSSAGALGLTQLMPRTAAGMEPGITREQILDRDTNLRLGMRYLRWLLRVYDGDLRTALHAYNRGIGTVDRIRSAGGDPANGYADRVMRVRE